MSTNLKNKKGNWTGEEVVVLPEEVKKSKPYLFETAPIHRNTDDLKGHGYLHTRAESCQLSNTVKLL